MDILRKISNMPSKRKLAEGLHQKFPEMDIDEIKDAYDKFKRHTNGRRQLKLGDFKKVYQQAFGEKADHIAELIFNAFDSNGDGKVSFEEFLIGMKMSENRPDRAGRLDTLKWAFSVYDSDRSGAIDRREMRSLVKAVFDLSAAQVHEISKSPDDYADDLFDAVDANHDGMITFEEFCRASEEDGTLIDMLMPAPDDDRAAS